jgi:hypothetical protein
MKTCWGVELNWQISFTALVLCLHDPLDRGQNERKVGLEAVVKKEVSAVASSETLVL